MHHRINKQSMYIDILMSYILASCESVSLNVGRCQLCSCSGRLCREVAVWGGQLFVMLYFLGAVLLSSCLCLHWFAIICYFVF